MEYIQLFDENKNMLNEGIERSRKENIPEGKYFMIILLFIENDNHEFLIQKTSKERDNVFATTGGHVSLGDNNIKTVIKEAKEELGIDLKEDEIEFVYSKKHHIAYCDTFYVHKNIDIKDIKVQKEEVDYVEWMSVDKINKLIEEDKFRKRNVEKFRKVLEYIDKKY